MNVARARDEASFEHQLARELAGLDAANRRRTLAPPAGSDWSSNDYLALSTHPQLLSRALAHLGGGPATSPASRLLRGHTPPHAVLEARLAAFKGAEAALLFPSGYQANLGVVTALVSPRDRVLSDRLNHASLIDAIRLSGATKRIVPHRDVDAIARTLRHRHPEGRTFLITESLYSMDGDVAPLDAYADLTERAGAELIVDDAHATGLFGDERGSGLVERFGVADRVTAVVTTFGKALGAAGACVTGSRTVIDYLVNRSRPFIFSTAPPPLLLAVVQAALDLLAAEPDRRARVHQLARRLRAGLAAGGLAVPAGEGPIVPVVLGGAERALHVAAGLQRRGFDVRAVRPPTVPEGSARLRLSVHADRTEREVDALVAALREEARERRALAVP